MEDLQHTEILLRLLLATGAGMVLGLEREWREKAAGFRTLALVSLGSAAFLLLAAGFAPDSAGRAVAGVVTGVGFLGAGAILREHGEVIGLTTAAAVWMAAALGLAAAAGDFYLTGGGLVLSLIVLLLFPIVDLTPYVRDARMYEIEYRRVAWDLDVLSRPLRQVGLVVTVSSVTEADGRLVVRWRATGRPRLHEEALRRLSVNDDIVRLSVS